MCGIFGHWRRGSGAVSVDQLARAGHLLAHRGPDGEGFHRGATFTFDPVMESPSLSIYDAHGRLVDVLRPGGGSAKWSPGDRAPSGVYFARLANGGRGQTVRFLVVR